jgi:hypothetical protein
MSDNHDQVVYMVRKEAVYPHECRGIFTTLDAAKQCARAVAAREDGHHEVMVYPFTLDEAGAFNGEDGARHAGVDEPVMAVAYRLFPNRRYGSPEGTKHVIQEARSRESVFDRFDWHTLTEDAP